MAEAASSAIGIISFGLTACKGLYEYYHAYKSFDSSISSAFESIAQVASTLVLLKDSFHDPGLDRERRDKVEACVSDCEGVLTRLNKKSQDLKTKDPEGFRGKAKAQFQQHAFVVAALGYENQTTARDPLPGWFWPTVASAILGFGALYGLSIYAFSWEVKGKTIGSRLGFEVKVYRPEDGGVSKELAEALRESEADGTGRRIELNLI